MADEEKFGHGPETMPGRTPDRRPEPDRGPADFAPIRYRPNRWETGITSLSADRMNHIEEGIARVTDLTASLCGRVNGIDASLHYVDEHTGRVVNVLDVLREQIRGIREDTDNLLDGWRGLLKSYDDTNKKVGALEHKLDDATERFSDKYNLLDERLKNLLARVNSVEAELRSRMDAVEAGLAEMKEDNEAFKAEVEAALAEAKAAYEELEEKYKGLLTYFNTLYDKVDKLSTDFEEYKETTDASLAGALSDIEKLKNATAKLTHQIEDIHSEIDSNMENINLRFENMQLVIDAINHRIDDDEEKIADLSEQIDSLVDGLEEKVKEWVDADIKDSEFVKEVIEEALKDEIEEIIKEAVDEAVAEKIDDEIDKALDERDLVTKSDVEDIVNEVIDGKDLVTKDTVEDIVNEVIDERGLVTQDELETEVKSEVEKALEYSDFATKEYVDEKIESITGDWVTEERAGEIADEHIEEYLKDKNYVTEEELETSVTNNIEVYLEENNYVTETDVGQYLYDNDYINKEEIEKLISSSGADVVMDKEEPTVNTVGGLAAGTVIYGETLKDILITILWGEGGGGGGLSPVINSITTDKFVLYGDSTSTVTGTADIDNGYNSFTVNGISADIDAEGNFTVTLTGLTPGSNSLTCTASNTYGSATKVATVTVVTAAYETTQEYDSPISVLLREGEYSEEDTVDEYSFIQNDIPFEADAIYQFKAIEECDKYDRNEVYIPLIFELVGVSAYDNLTEEWQWFQGFQIDEADKVYNKINTAKTFNIGGVDVEYTGYRIHDEVLHPLADKTMRYFVRLR